jgi:hypothetical protein
MTVSTAPRWLRKDLAYCSNVHPGETVDEIVTRVLPEVGAVRRARGLSRMASGLWVSAEAAASLRDLSVRRRFADAVAEHHIDLLTLNGFPYGGFHAEVVKEAVYLPDWSDPRRLEYTLDLADLLADCCSSGHRELSLSTLPLGFRPDWSESRHEQALSALCRLAERLAELHERTGASVRACLEPEPGCVVETTEDALRLIAGELPDQAKRMGLPRALLERHLGVCFDVCHQAVMFENPGASLTRLTQGGVVVGKIQLSSALVVEDPDLLASRSALEDFAEPKYFHQVRCEGTGGRVSGVMDLPEALAGELPTVSPWRIHFHLPIQLSELDSPNLGTTRSALGEVFDWLAAHPKQKPHLEAETYTWHVLPSSLRPTDDLALRGGLAAELAWVEAELERRGLLEAA